MDKVENVKILIADDTPANVKIIEKFIQPRGYETIIAENGAEAVEKFKEHKPDIVLMDIMMPVKDGYEAAKEIKELSGPNWVPLIFLSAKSSIEEQIEGISIGGDDYLTKPVDLRMLESKLRAMLRIVKMQQELNKTSHELQNYYNKAEEEMELAKQLMDNLTSQLKMKRPDFIKVHNTPADKLSGDVIVTSCDGDGRCYILLADATGHGLSAAISQIPVTQVFNHMVEKAYSVKAIARRINSALNELLPPDRFVAATIACIDFNSQFIELWNGSNPRPLFVSKEGKIEKVFEKTNFALGMVNNDAFMSNVECYKWEGEGELLIYSDGLTEAKDQNGEDFGYERLKTVVANHVASDNESHYDKVLNELDNFKDKHNKFDDISLLAVKCSLQS